MTLPPLWKWNHPGTAVFRRLGSAFVKVYKHPGRGDVTCSVELRLDATDIAEACMLAESVAASWLAAHRATGESAA